MSPQHSRPRKRSASPYSPAPRACSGRTCDQCGELATDGKIDDTVNQWYCAACWFAYESGAEPGAAASAPSSARHDTHTRKAMKEVEEAKAQLEKQKQEMELKLEKQQQEMKLEQEKQQLALSTSASDTQTNSPRLTDRGVQRKSSKRRRPRRRKRRQRRRRRLSSRRRRRSTRSR